MSNFNIEIKEIMDKGYCIFKLISSGPLAENELDGLKPLFMKIYEKGCRKYLFDLGSLDEFNSDLLGKLVYIHRVLEKENGTMIICGANIKVMEILRITKLDSIFFIARNCRDALMILEQPEVSDSF